MTSVDDLARFVVASTWEDVSDDARAALKARLIDSLGCAIGALDGEPMRAIRADVDEFATGGACSLIGGGKASPFDAALVNGALVRYLDFNDSYLAPGETCHPSDNLGAVLAAAQYARASGRDLLVALAVAYQVQCRFCDEAPVRWRHFDHVTQGAYAAAAGVARALGLDAEQTANALAMAGTALNALRVTRTSLSNWKGLAYPFAAFAATRAAFLARRGISGPRGVIDGRKGFMEAIAGPFEIDWASESLDAVGRTIVKKFNAEIHSQSALEILVELRRSHGLDPSRVERVDLDVFDVAYSIIGGGDDGPKHDVRTKEEADHSLPYMAAAALVDGDVTPAQYDDARLAGDDVQGLMRHVHVHVDDDFSARFPRQLPSRARIHLVDGTVLVDTKFDYEGFVTRPMSRAVLLDKFEKLTRPHADASLGRAIVDCVDDLEHETVDDLAVLLERAAATPGTAV